LRMKLVIVPTTRSPPCMAFRSSVPFIEPKPPSRMSIEEWRM
jgi:hypothetical protein